MQKMKPKNLNKIVINALAFELLEHMKLVRHFDGNYVGLHEKVYSHKKFEIKVPELEILVTKIGNDSYFISVLRDYKRAPKDKFTFVDFNRVRIDYTRKNLFLENKEVITNTLGYTYEEYLDSTKEFDTCTIDIFHVKLEDVSLLDSIIEQIVNQMDINIILLIPMINPPLETVISNSSSIVNTGFLIPFLNLINE